MDELHVWEMGWIYALQTLRGPILDQFFLFLNFFDRQEFLMILIPAIWLGYSWKSGARIFAITMLSGIVNFLLKRMIGEPRPCHFDPSCGLLFFFSYGFPSGAAQQAVLLGGILMKTFRTYFIGINYIFWISLSRVYLGVHFPSDIVGGWLVGALLLGFYYRCLPKIEQRVKTYPFVVKFWLALLVPSLAPLIYFSPKMVAAAFLSYGVGLGMLLSQKLRVLSEDPKTLSQGIRRACFAIATLFLLYFATNFLIRDVNPFVQNFLLGIWISFGIYLFLKQKYLVVE